MTKSNIYPIKSSSQSGFTLLELLVVIGVISLMMGITINVVGSSFESQARKEASHLLSTIRYVYNEAATQNLTHRIVFDLSEQQYWVEVGSEEFLMESSDPIERAKKAEQEKKKKKDEGQSKGDEEEAAAPPAFSLAEGLLSKKILFDKEVKLRDVFVSHQEAPMAEGQAYLYFFPQGYTEQAVIHFSDEEEENNYSIIVNPITGRCKVVADYVDVKDLEE